MYREREGEGEGKGENLGWIDLSKRGGQDVPVCHFLREGRRSAQVESLKGSWMLKRPLDGEFGR